VPSPLAVTGDPDADALVNDEPLALLIAMLLDQQVSIELAFRGPARLVERLGGRLEAHRIAEMDPDAFAAVAAAKPALHRFPRAMAQRIQALCGAIAQRCDGDAAALWHDVEPAEEVHRRLVALPGFGDEKARILLAVLAKRFGVRPDGWEQAAAPFGDDQPRSVADIDGPAALARVKAWKAAQRAAGRSKADPPVSG
jgi:uncharacterized HhH-GPD family protein